MKLFESYQNFSYFSSPVVFIIIILPSNLFSINFKTACDLLNLPRECHCQRTRNIPIYSFNETRLRCRQLTEIATNYHWSSISYDHLAFETFNDNLTVHRFVFSNIIIRTLRFNTQYLILNDHTFNNAYIGQLGITHQDTYGRIYFELNGQIFYDTTITNLFFKFIDFEIPISEISFSNSKIYSFLIQSSKFYGFTNQNNDIISKTITNIKYDHFLEYDILLPKRQKKISQQLYELNDENSSIDSENTITINVSLMTNPIYIIIFTIISSINTTNLTENYFPNNLEYSQTEEIELSFNQINTLNAHTFRHLKQFKGRLILRNNQIRYLNPYGLTDLSLVKNLSLSKNFIKHLTSIHFKELNQLYELDLSFNQIYELNNNIFKYLYNLHILYLNHNPLELIHSNAFSNLTKLKQIHFQGVKFIHLVDLWIWNLANLHVIHLLKTDFDLSDVAFCILSNYNQTLFHLSHQYFCSCNIHYFNFNQYFIENTSISILKYNRNYLRLTPICNKNETETISKQQTNESNLIFHDLEDNCDYKLMFLDCDAMATTPTTTTLTTTTTTTPTTTTTITTTTTTTMPSTIEMTRLFDIEIETTYISDILIHQTTEIPVPLTKTWIIPTTTQETPLNNIKKLFTVLGTLIAITIGAIVFVYFWYRFKGILRQKKKKKTFLVQQQGHFNSPILNHHHHHLSIAIHYASSDILGSINNVHLSRSKSHSQTLIEPPILQSLSMYKNTESIDNDQIVNFIDDESIQQYSGDVSIADMQAISQC
ncbi:unnamed protein product [Rotaria sordida]|uniref:Uncharacterized protein n=1 Tax=Rotaria sordida TaxID=392033 RepID=A0A814VR92_9BILA|nr:unnamed protein product [Rotaria sordida]CAF3665554.1 unnamed protein product [Rotaria sordida]